MANLTNSQKVEILNQNGYKLNPFTETMFGQKTYHIEYEHPVVRVGNVVHTHGLTMEHIRKRNKSIIKQSELDLITNEVELNNLIKSKK